MSQRILVVDDEPAIADAVADRLRSDGYDVAVVHDGLAAVAYCRATPPDLMVLDLMLPGLDGVGQMLRQTERLGRMVPQLLDLSRLESGASTSCWSTSANWSRWDAARHRDQLECTPGS